TAMNTPSTTRLFRQVLLSTALAGGMLLAFAGTSLRADDEVRADRKVLDAIMGGIGFKREKAGIEYRERAPLVVPPSLNLPPPRTADKAPAAPAWPNDQDVRRTSELERARKLSQSWDEYEDWKSGRELTTAERERGRLAKGSDRAKGDYST